jgi:hypothetical protein
MVSLFMGFFKNVTSVNGEGLLYQYILELFIAYVILNSIEYHMLVVFVVICIFFIVSVIWYL